MLEPKCQIDWSKDGSSNLADLHWSDLPQEEGLVICIADINSEQNLSDIKTVDPGVQLYLVLASAFISNAKSLIEQEKLNDRYEKPIGYEQGIIEEQKRTLNDEDIKALLKHRQLLSRIERLTEA